MKTREKEMQNIYYISEDLGLQTKVSSSMSFEEYSELWIAENESVLSPKTAARYRSLLLRINMGIGHLSLQKITSHHLNAFYKRLAQNGVNQRTGGRLSDKTILHHHRLISVILQQAAREQLIGFNPASKEYMKPPKAHTKEAACLQVSDVNKLLQIMRQEDIKWRTLIVILLCTGMRRGEVLGLEWQDIDLISNTIDVRRTSQYTSVRGIYTKEPKTKKSIRTFKFDDAMLIDALSEYKEEYSMRFGSPSRGKRLFLQSDCKPMHPDSVTDYIKKLRERYDLPYFTAHTLRHTYVSIMIALNVPLKEISEKVGHAQLTTTCNTYAHLIALHNAKALAPLESIL